MADPISGAGGGAAKLALQEMLKQQQQQTQMQNPAQSGQSSSFAAKLNSPQQTQQTQQVSEVQKSHQAAKPRSIRDMAKVNQTQRVDASKKAQGTELNKANGDKGNASFKGLFKAFEGMKSRKASLDALIHKAMKGQSFSQKELLVLQYKASLYSLEMNLTSKVVEKATSGIKQAMNTQV